MKLGDHSTIPLTWLFVSLPFFVGAVLWLSFIAYTAQASSERISSLEKDRDAKYEILVEIRERVVRIEERLRTNTQ